MRKQLLTLTVAVATLAIPAGFVWALRVAIPPGPNRIVNADAVFIGKVTAIEPAEVDAKPYPTSKTTVKYKIAVVRVDEIIRGLKEVKSVRVGFVAPVAPKPGGLVLGGGRSPQMQVGQEGLFMITAHGDGKFYQAPDFGLFVPTAQKNFADEVKLAKKVVTILGNPNQTLESKDADERLLAAAILIGQYRTSKPGVQSKEEPIDAAQSKLILHALSTSNWKAVPYGQPDAWNLFNQLGLTPQDGWKAPVNLRTLDDRRNAVQAWVKDHGETYRVRRLVAPASRAP